MWAVSNLYFFFERKRIGVALLPEQCGRFKIVSFELLCFARDLAAGERKDRPKMQHFPDECTISNLS